MLNFAVGPVQMDPDIQAVGGGEIPYFRTPEFSKLMKENERRILRLAGAGAGARALFLTASGTGAMEAAVINQFTKADRILVAAGGSFGERFIKICQVHGLHCTAIRPGRERGLTAADLEPFEGEVYTGFLVNAHETSTCVAYDMDLISSFCERNHLRLVVDGISSFLADPFNMEGWGVDVLLTGSQKALALPPGLSILILSERAVFRVYQIQAPSLYFDLKDYLNDGLRGQTPYTPAVGILLQLNERLKQIEGEGRSQGRTGLECADLQAEKTRVLAEDFRRRISGLPFCIPSQSLSNAATPLKPIGRKENGEPVSAGEIVRILKDEYGIFVCPNGGDTADTIFRVGHLGSLTVEDNRRLEEAFRDMQNRGVL